MLVTADHGFSTISKRDVDASGRRTTRSYAATRTYREASGRQEVNPGSLPPGFVAIDLARREPDAYVVAIWCDTGARYLSDPHRWEES